MRVDVLSNENEHFDDGGCSSDAPIAAEESCNDHADELDDAEDDPHLYVDLVELPLRILERHQEPALQHTRCKHKATVDIFEWLGGLGRLLHVGRNRDQMDHSCDKNEIEPVNLSDVVGKCIGLVSVRVGLQVEAEQSLNLHFHQEECARKDLEQEARDLNEQPCPLLLQHFVFCKVLRLHIMFADGPDGVHGNKEVGEHAQRLECLLGEHEFIKLGRRREAVVRHFVHDVCNMSPPVILDVVQEVSVQVRLVWILNNNETGQEQRNVEDHVPATEYDAVKWLVCTHLLI